MQQEEIAALKRQLESLTLQVPAKADVPPEYTCPISQVRARPACCSVLPAPSFFVAARARAHVCVRVCMAMWTICGGLWSSVMGGKQRQRAPTLVVLERRRVGGIGKVGLRPSCG